MLFPIRRRVELKICREIYKYNVEVRGVSMYRKSNSREYNSCNSSLRAQGLLKHLIEFIYTYIAYIYIVL